MALNTIYRTIRTAGWVAFPVVVALCIAGCRTTQEVCTSEGRHTLWRIKGDRNTVYLMGSVHALPESAYPLDPILDCAYKDAEVLAFEAMIDSNAIAETQVWMLTNGIRTDGKVLEDVLPKQTYEKIAAAFDSAGMSIEMFGMLKPWVIGAVLAQLELQKAGFEAEKGLDLHFQEKSKSVKKKTVALEGVVFQLELLNNLPDEDQVAFLEQSLEQTEGKNSEGVLETIAAAWKTGDVVTLERLMKDDFGNQALLPCPHHQQEQELGSCY